MNAFYALCIGCGMGFGVVAGCVGLLYVADWRDKRKQRRVERTRRAQVAVLLDIERIAARRWSQHDDAEAATE